MPSAVARVSGAASAVARADGPDSSIAAAVAAASLAAHVDAPRSLRSAGDAATSLVARAFAGSAIWIFEPSGQRVLIVLGSIFRVKSGTTVYLATGLSTNEADVWVPLSAGTALELQVGVDQDAGAGSYVATLRKEGADTALAVTLTGTTRKGSSSGAVAFAGGDRLAIKLVPSGGAPDAYVNVSIKYQFAS